MHLQARDILSGYCCGFAARLRHGMALSLIMSAVLLTFHTINGIASDESPRVMRSPGPSLDITSAPRASASYGRLPLSFEANHGQSDPQVRFLSRGPGYSLFLTDKEAVLALRKPGAHEAAEPADRLSTHSHQSAKRFKTDVVRMQLAGAASDLRVAGENEMPGRANYFIGSDSKRWQSGIPTYREVKYPGVYPGVDLVYYGNEGRLEYDFVVAPGSSANSIRLHFAGAKRLELDRNGDLRIIAGNGEIAFHRPVVYQQAAGARRYLAGRYDLLANNTVGFSLGRYDHHQALIIDPVLVYSTYLGGSTADGATAIAVDGAGDAYVTGATLSVNFPVTAGAFQAASDKSTAASTAFIAKFNATGTALLYATYLGGSTADSANAIAVDASGDAYVTGETESTDFPVTAGALQSQNNNVGGGYTGFVSKLNADGSALVYSTYLGGTDSKFVDPTGEDAHGIAVDGNGDAFVVGFTASPDFPVTNGAFQTSFTTFAGAGFVAALNPTGTALIYATFLGGNSQSSEAIAVAVDSAGSAYVGGTTACTSFPITAGAVETSFTGNNAAFVTKLNPTGTAVVYSTYLGGSSLSQSDGTADAVNGIALDAAGDAIVAGVTSSTAFPVTSGAFQAKNPNGSTDDQSSGFIAKLNPTAQSLLYSTYLGGNHSTVVYGIQVDGSGDAYVGGNTLASNFPVTANALQSTDPTDSTAGSGFVSELNPQGTALIYSSYLGGTNGATVQGLSLDGSLNVYLTGSTLSVNFPVTPGAFQTTHPDFELGSATGSAFVTKIDLRVALTKVATTVAISASPNPQAAGGSVTFTVSVTPKSGTGTPTGEITTTIDGAAGPALTLANGKASYSTTSLAAGSHTIVATYGGDTNYLASSATVVETITSATGTTAAASIAVVSGSGQTTGYGSAFPSPLVVIVKDARGNPVSGAVVNFAGAGLDFAAVPATTGSNGEASVTATATAVGSLTAAASTAGVTGTAKFSLTATSLGPTPTPSFTPGAGTYTSAQQVTIGDSAPGALIYYTLGGAAPSTSSTRYSGALTVDGTQTINAIAVAPGHTDSAVATAIYTIDLSPASFELSASPTTATINPGGSAMFKLTVTPENGFSRAVSFSCSGLPSGDACSFSPQTVTPAGAAVNTTLTIAPAIAAQGANSRLWEGTGGSLAFAVLLWPFGRRRLGTRCAMALLSLPILFMLGCEKAPTAQSYTVAVTASGGSVAQTTSLVLTVTQ